MKESEAGVEAALDHPSVGMLETLLMCWLATVTFMLAKPALSLVCCRCNNRPLHEYNLANCNGRL